MGAILEDKVKYATFSLFPKWESVFYKRSFSFYSYITD
ncbi:hypothetical protein B4110_0460 [Parageobacillus toebii]|uniref:Uncharacterized protein n=1 Tax=Parageobacillus toebii TaxID=153151 RepID=A0A150MSX5_9BACL|nr:hypothetical protein B4110_0460 [Parageobacillus toebii]